MNMDKKKHKHPTVLAKFKKQIINGFYFTLNWPTFDFEQSGKIHNHLYMNIFLCSIYSHFVLIKVVTSFFEY